MKETGPSNWHRFTVVIPTECIDLWEAAKDRAQREGLELSPSVPEPIHNGQVLEILMAEYLAGPEAPPDFYR